MTRFFTLLLMASTLILSVMPIYANPTDSSTIKINVVHEGKMTVSGSVLSGKRANTNMVDIKRKQAINLGTLNIESMINYDVAFKSVNGYRLKNANETFAEYNVEYDGNNIILNSTHLNSKESRMGVYEDTLTVVVTVP